MSHSYQSAHNGGAGDRNVLAGSAGVLARFNKGPPPEAARLVFLCHCRSQADAAQTAAFPAKTLLHTYLFRGISRIQRHGMRKLCGTGRLSQCRIVNQPTMAAQAIEMFWPGARASSPNGIYFLRFLPVSPFQRSFVLCSSPGVRCAHPRLLSIAPPGL